MERWLDVAIALAEAAGAAIRPYFRAGVAADAKDDASPVTIADREAEQAMRAVLAQRCPEHGVIGEELGHERPEAALCWVLDPIDGTRAFITGRPTFATLIALLADGEPVLGVIDQPISGERWIGVRGQATRFHGPGRAGCRPCRSLAEAELSCTSPELFEGARAAGFERVRRAARRVTWGGDGYAYGLLALGGIDAIVEPGLKLWDWAALAPVIEGAGGMVRSWSGTRLERDGPGDVIAVGDPALLPQIVALLA